MNLERLVSIACDKDYFRDIDRYCDFAKSYLEFIKDNLQAVIVSRNENNYQFFQYKDDGTPANKSNTARKINGDLFERFIRLIIGKVGVYVTQGTVQVPVKINGKVEFTMNYQHDLIVKELEEVRAIGSVKTSSKDRLAKIFVDKFLYNRLTDRDTPHFAIFLNDVQRKDRDGNYGINTTFLSGHFKGYTVKLNPLDGVYYFDIRPDMQVKDILKDHIKTFDHFLFGDIWKLVR